MKNKLNISRGIEYLVLWFGFLVISNAMYTNYWFDILPVAALLKRNADVEYRKCYDVQSFEYLPFALSINPASHPYKGFFHETFILNIPNGQVQSYGLVLVENIFIQELIWKNFSHNLAHVQRYDQSEIIHISGRVAVIGQPAAHNYFHWLTEVLCRLALLELQGIDYDYLYVPYDLHFMQESLQLWGIDPAKIIAAHPNLCIQADQLIVPSFVSHTSFGGVLGACYVQFHLLNYVKNKLLTAALQSKASIDLSSKVFISRKDAPQRKVINEDQVFKLFQKKGFVRYELDKLSVTDQILLFDQAKVVVSPQGTGLANTVFCQKGTRVIELLQGLNDCTFWYMSQTLNLNYTPIKTISFIDDYVSAWASNTYMPLLVIKKVIEDLAV